MFRYIFRTEDHYIKKVFPVSKCAAVIGLMLIISGYGCTRHNHNVLKEGVIQYNIEYSANHLSQKFPLQMLPNSMEMKFNQNFFSFTLKDAVGLFYLSSVTNLKDQTSFVLIKVFDKKYVYSGPIEDGPVFFHNATPYSVTYSDDTLRLAGVLCHKARVTDSVLHRSFDVAYSSDVNMDNMYKETPYREIDGLLLKFMVQMGNLEISFTAKKYIEKKIADQDFVIPEGYKFISKDQATKIISSLLP